MPSVATQNKVRVTVAVDDIDLGSFLTHEGGGVSGETTKIRPGGGEQQIVLTSTKEYGNLTLTALYTDGLRARRLWLDKRVNKGAMVVAAQPLDADDNPFGTPDVWRGTLIRFDTPGSDANASGDGAASICEFEMAVEKWA